VVSADPAVLRHAKLPCIHVDHHDKNNTCDDAPSTNLPSVQECGHGNAFAFANSTIQNQNCPNWGEGGACLASTTQNLSGSPVVAGPCAANGAIWGTL
jgi:hypothetical protein